MTVLWLHLGFVFVLSFLARYYCKPAPLQGDFIIPHRVLVFFVCVSFILVSGLRNNIGDTVFYMHSYETTDFLRSIYMDQKDIGFNLFQLLLKFISDDPQLLIFATALITYSLLVLGFFKYSRIFELSIFVFIASGAFVVSMNGMRQYLAASIIFAATGYILKGNWKKYTLVIIFASFFHQSALVMIPLYFLVRKKAWTAATLILLSIAVAIVIGYNQFSSFLFSALKETQYGNYQSFSEGGANYVRVLVSVPTIAIAFFGREKLRSMNPRIDVFVNLSLVGFVIMIISTQNWIFARMAIYFSLYHIVLTSWIVKVFRPKDQKLIYLLLIICYLIFFFYENVIALDLKYRSDYITWFS